MAHPILKRLPHLSAWGLLALGCALQFVIKDRWSGLALLFYGMPKPCLTGLALLLIVWPDARRISRLLALVAACLLGGSWLAISWHRAPPVSSSDSSSTLRVLFWNLARPEGVHEGLIQLVRETQPDIVGLVEPGRNVGALLEDYRAALPDYQVEWMPRGLLWLSRLPSRYRERGKLEGIGAFARFEVHHSGQSFPVVVADVYAHAFHSRRGQLAEALAYAQERSDALLLGDFNTPWESIFFDAYRARYQHAFQAAGQGFQETWPLHLPLLSLDHIWVGKDWQVLSARKFWRVPHSDHAALLVSLRRR